MNNVTTLAGNAQPSTIVAKVVCAAHAGPIDEDTLVYRIELHAVDPDD